MSTRNIITDLVRSNPLLGVGDLCRITGRSRCRIDALLNEEGFSKEARDAARQEVLSELQSKYMTAGA